MPGVFARVLTYPIVMSVLYQIYHYRTYPHITEHNLGKDNTATIKYTAGIFRGKKYINQWYKNSSSSSAVVPVTSTPHTVTNGFVLRRKYCC